jgi:hypothetical protein
VQRSAAVLFVGNNAYDTGLAQLGARPELNQCLLWVTMPTSSTRCGLLMRVFAIILGRDNVEDIYKF